MAQQLKITFWKRSLVVVIAFMAMSGSTQAADSLSLGSRNLQSKYAEIRDKLEKNQFNTPLYLQSTEGKESLHVDVYGIFKYPFDSVRKALQTPAHWCDITPLHINIKGCVSVKKGMLWQLNLYSGRKYYQSPEDAYEIDFIFHDIEQKPNYLNLVITADEGPLFTKDHRINLEAIPLGDTAATFIHFSYAYKYGRFARTAIKTYFATIARDKMGFSIASTDDSGKPEYVRGVRGAVERNAVRYFLAVQAYMETSELPEEQRFEKRLSRWYDLTAKHPQLYEMDKAEYMDTKRREHKNQRILQKEQGH